MSKLRIAAALLLGFTLLYAPGLARADSHHEDISITRDGEFDAAHGVHSGKGTMMDPYVISGLDMYNLSISDTSKAVKIVKNTITGTLTLNWVGKDVLVEKNEIGDLRVNENVARYGMPMAGVFQNNTFVSVSQIRHFDGKFIHNTVGFQPGTLSSIRLFGLFSGPAVNFDGYNGALFAYNTVYGYVDARLHGHHHSSGFGLPSHMHAGPMEGKVDHTERYHEVTIRDNTIYAEGNSYALSYLDTNHADNDRTANSETNPDLNAPHVHHTRVHLLNNKLIGGGIFVDVFNANDELHKKIAWGSMDIAGNVISLDHNQAFYPFESVFGIDVERAQGLALTIKNNRITAPSAQYTQFEDLPWRGWQTPGTGIAMNDLDWANVLIANDSVTNLDTGVSASQMTKKVQWTVKGLKTSGVQQNVSYDSSVENAPKTK